MNTGKNDVIGILNKVKEQAIREFAERYKNEINNRYEDIAYKDLFFKAIDNLVKEMTGGEENAV